MIYFVLTIGLLFAVAILPLHVAAALGIAILIEALCVVAAATLVIGTITFWDALKAVAMSNLLIIVAVAFMLPAVMKYGPVSWFATFIVVFAAATKGISIALQSTFWQAAIIMVIIAVIDWAVSGLFGFSLKLATAA